MYKVQLRMLAIVAFVMALIGTGLGGYADMTNQPLVISKQHAWNDGLFLIGVAIFLLLLSAF